MGRVNIDGLESDPPVTFYSPGEKFATEAEGDGKRRLWQVRTDGTFALIASWWPGAGDNIPEQAS